MITKPKVSCIIPSYKDPLLHKTIDSLLENAEGEIEIIVALDGYWPSKPIKNDPRIRIVHLGKNRGMRGAINAAAALARGEFLMRTDEHCMFDKGFDRKLTERFKDDWIVYPVRYYLDPVKWEVMDIAPNVYNKLIIDTSHMKWSGVNWKSREEARKDKMIDESMAMQGSCWIMKKSWWDKVIKELQSEGYGTLYGDSHEMVFKTWKAGGRLMVNKYTWHAHKHRDFPRTHNTGSKESAPGWLYSLNLWRDYYEKEIAPKWGLVVPEVKPKVQTGAEKEVDHYSRKFLRKLGQFNKPMQLPHYFEHLIGDKKRVRIAELGAGAINTIGQYWPGVEVEILASDVLWPEYEKLWAQTKDVPVTKIEYADMENLPYPDESFDIVHCCNALDHTKNAQKALQEMKRICKPGGVVYILCAEDQKRRFSGMHEWNARMEDGDSFVMKDGSTGDFYIRDILEGAEEYTEVQDQFHNKDGVLCIAIWRKI